MAQLTPADLLARLGVPEPQTMAEYDALLDLAIQEILKTDNKSGYRDVYKCGSTVNPWQAKPYIRPKVQRNLGSFLTPEGPPRRSSDGCLAASPTRPRHIRTATSVARAVRLATAATKARVRA